MSHENIHFFVHSVYAALGSKTFWHYNIGYLKKSETQNTKLLQYDTLICYNIVIISFQMAPRTGSGDGANFRRGHGEAIPKDAEGALQIRECTGPAL